jgi:hypothetical protein
MPKKEKPRAKLKKVKQSPPILNQEEANALERKIIRGEEKIDSPELKEILEEQRIIQKSSPSLGKVNAPQRNSIILENNLDNSASVNLPNNEEDPFKYNSGGKKSGESKYVRYEGGTGGDIIPHGDIMNVGKESIFQRRNIGFENSPQAKIGAQENFEKYSPVKNVEKERLGKENPFQRKEIKYSPEKY